MSIWNHCYLYRNQTWTVIESPPIKKNMRTLKATWTIEDRNPFNSSRTHRPQPYLAFSGAISPHLIVLHMLFCAQLPCPYSQVSLVFTECACFLPNSSRSRISAPLGLEAWIWSSRYSVSESCLSGLLGLRSFPFFSGPFVIAAVHDTDVLVYLEFHL